MQNFDRRGFFGFVGGLSLASVLPKIEVKAPEPAFWKQLPQLCVCQPMNPKPGISPGTWYGRNQDGTTFRLGIPLRVKALTWRPMAMRFQPGGTTEFSTEPESPLFKEIATGVVHNERYCMLGPQMVVNANNRPLIWFAGTRSARRILLAGWNSMFNGGAILKSTHIENRGHHWVVPRLAPLLAGEGARWLTPIFPGFNDDAATRP